MWLSCVDLVVKVSRVPLVVLVAAVLRWWFLSFRVIAHVVLEDAGESHGRQHADHRSECQHQADHHAGEIHSTDGIQGHCGAQQDRRKLLLHKPGRNWKKMLSV